MRKEPAQRSMRRHARRPMRSGWLRGLYLAARLRAAEARWPRTGAAGPCSRYPEPGSARNVSVGQPVAWPRSQFQTGGCQDCPSHSSIGAATKMKKKLHVVGELMNNSYARARKAFTTRNPISYAQLA